MTGGGAAQRLFALVCTANVCVPFRDRAVACSERCCTGCERGLRSFVASCRKLRPTYASSGPCLLSTSRLKKKMTPSR